VELNTLVIIGAGGHAKVVVEAVRARTPDRKIILLDDEPQNQGRSVLDVMVEGGRDRLSADLKCATVALGVGNNEARSAIMVWLTSRGHQLETVIHPAAVVGPTVVVGSGAFIAAGSIAIAEATIRAGAIINTAASVDHDCDVGEAAHIAPGVRLCGNVHVGARTLIGVGSSVRPGVTIGPDVPGPGCFAGCPARPLSS
jgi:sugar O-acyltransferase (sialic acid O-acetyltransferase NeuD family)